MLINTPLAQFTQLINGAFKNYQSVLALARSPLADSALVHPLLVLDDVSPTADERGHALRLVLQWAVSRLAPGPIAHPLGSERPYDDPTWRDPRWWRYNILRHRYLEPLHPDEFVDGGRFTETLLALTGITSADAFFDERNRAIREVAQRLQEQLRHGEANDELQTLALDEVLRPLQGSPEQEELLGIAATFDDVFPRHLLLQMARAERLSAADHLLDELTTRRFLLMGDGGTNLWLSPVLQHHVYSRQPAAKIRSRHLAVAAYYRRQEEPLKAAEHLQQAENWAAAAQLLLSATEELVNDLQTDELLAALTRFKADQLEATTWCAVQLICCDLYRRHGQPEAALTVCRHALRTTTDPSQQGQLYWRMGKLYEKRNQPQALGYYERALSSFAEEDPARIALLKDRAWLYLLRREWMAAQTDLHRALALIDLQVTAPRTTQLGTLLTGMQSIIELHANVLDALAHLHLEQSHFSAAIDYAQRALHLREEAGDLLQVAKSFNNLGNFYSRMGEVNAAVAAHDEAIQLYQRLNNLELEAEAWLNRGAVYHTAGRQRDAIENYHKSLALSQQLNLLWAEVTAHANLTEAHAELDELKAAQRHWHYGHELSRQAAFADDIAYFVELRERFDLGKAQDEDTLPSANSAQSAVADATHPLVLPPRALLSPDEQAVLTLAERHGKLTAKLVMTTQHVSKATATRRLAALTAVGLLLQRGKGRGTCYVPVTRFTEQRSQQPSPGVQEEASHRQPASMMAQALIATLQEQLQTLVPTLQQEHGVHALLLLPPWPNESQTARIAVHIAKGTTLTAFFQLEQWLRNTLAHPIDLIPVEQLQQYADADVIANGCWVTP